MENLKRTARGSVLALVIALAAAAPAAAAQPTRTVLPSGGGFTLPAGSACAFDVEAQPTEVTVRNGFVANTEFSDGSVLHFVRAKGAYVNPDGGARYQTEDTYRDLSTYDADTNMLVGVESGSTTWSFLPGDVGPFGIVGENGALYHFIGSLSYTYDLNTFHTTQFSTTGRVIDVCAALSSQ